MDTLNPFDILGIEETDNRHVVMGAYRRMIRMVHPDKAVQLGWTPEECTEAFQKIKGAYQTIMKDYNFVDAPDYDIIYSMDNVDSINNTDFKECDTTSQFNKRFELSKKALNQNGGDDPNDVGFSNFSRNQNLGIQELEDLLTREYETSKPKKYIKHDTMVKHNPTALAPQNNSYEFGLTTIEDYGIASSSKSNTLNGTDISQVHNNDEPWEISVSRNTKLFEKYNNKDNGDLNRRLELLQSERDSINLGKEYEQSEHHYNSELKKNEIRVNQIRQVQQSRDEIHGKQYLTNANHIVAKGGY